LTEFHIWSLTDTFKFLERGGTISRLGDGELNLLSGSKGGWEKPKEKLRKALQFVANFGGNPEKNSMICVGLVQILDDKSLQHFRPGKRRDFWRSFRKKGRNVVQKYFPPGHYCDSMVSRPDNVDPQMFPFVFFDAMWQNVFKDLRVLLYHGNAKDPTVFKRHLTLASFVLKGSFKILPEHMFDNYVPFRNHIIQEVTTHDIDVVVLSVGPTATILAAELTCRGIRAIDVGQFGGKFEKK